MALVNNIAGMNPGYYMDNMIGLAYSETGVTPATPSLVVEAPTSNQRNNMQIPAAVPQYPVYPSGPAQSIYNANALADSQAILYQTGYTEGVLLPQSHPYVPNPPNQPAAPSNQPAAPSNQPAASSNQPATPPPADSGATSNPNVAVVASDWLTPGNIINAAAVLGLGYVVLTGSRGSSTTSAAAVTGLSKKTIQIGAIVAAVGLGAYFLLGSSSAAQPAQASAPAPMPQVNPPIVKQPTHWPTNLS